MIVLNQFQQIALLTYSSPDFYRLLIPAIVRLLVQDYSKSTFFLAYSLPLYNIAMAVLPLIKTRDELTDIPLTPSQRALMGLDPNAKSSTSDTQYITPPRYARSVTPRSSSGGWPSNDSNSPFSRRESPLYGRDRSDSPFSPSGSPLWQKAISKDRDAARRSSLGSPSPLGPGFNPKESILGVPSTPSPTAGKNTSVSLNSRWLYNRGRTSLARN